MMAYAALINIGELDREMGITVKMSEYAARGPYVAAEKLLQRT